MSKANFLGILFFVFLGVISSSLYANFEQEFPVLHKGRYRPAEAYASLWLYDIYHAQALKAADLEAFHTFNPSPLAFLWSLNAFGHTHYQTSPLFWIKSAEAKRLADLPIHRDHFSYKELHQALYENPKSRQAIVQRLIIYQFLKTHVDSSQPLLRIEISALLPGLWVQWQGDDLVLATVPQNSPWPFLKSGQVLLPNARLQAQEIAHRDRKLAEEWLTLLTSLKEFKALSGPFSSMELAFHDRLTHLQSKNLSSNEIEQTLEQEYPFIQRLRAAGILFKSLPSRYKEGEWFPLKALTIQMYQSSSQTLLPIGNFTLFSDKHFEAIRHAYLALEKSILGLAPLETQEQFSSSLAFALQQAYQPLAGKVYQQAHGKQLSYPSFAQLKMETLYIHYPWIPFLILLYGIGAGLLLISYRHVSSISYSFAIGVISLAIVCHTGLLAMRCYILGRPPVSNMFETVIYVPWVAACMSLFFPSFRKQPLVLLAACCAAITLLLILEVTDLHQSLDQVQAVLDSQFWLMIHVLMVVGSYGIFILGALIGHFYLALFIAHRKETSTMASLAKTILQTLYVGTTLLVIGTILGGIWAAESWGRFWDWDPKESWAFISSCFYLIWIHAYRFHRIASFGLAMGAVSGLLAISFTWYGVNYILGTGLHSYGFGSGGEYYYYAFLVLECLFLILALWAYSQKRPLISNSS